MEEFMKVQEEDPAARGIPPAGKRTGSRLQNMWRWRSWGGEGDTAQQGPSSSAPPGPRREHSRTVSAGSDMELTPWAGSATSGSYRRSSHSDGPAAGSELGQATSPLPRSTTPASASRRVSMSSSVPGVGDGEDLNSVHTQAGSVAHSFSSLHSMLQDLEGGSTAGGVVDPNSSSGGSGHPQYKPSLLGSPLFPGPSGLGRQQQQNQQQQQGDTASEPGDSLAPHRSLSTRSKASPSSEGDSSSCIAPSEQSTEGQPQMVGSLRLTEGQVLAATSAGSAGGAATSEGVPVGTQVAVHGDSSVAAEIGSQHSISSLLSSMSDWDAASRRSTGAVSTREEAPSVAPSTTGSTATPGNSSQVDLDPLAAHAAALAAAPAVAGTEEQGTAANPTVDSSGQDGALQGSPSRPSPAAADPLGALPVDQPAAAAGGDSSKKPLQGAVKGMMKWGSGLGQRLQRGSGSASSSNSSISKAAGSQQELISRSAE